MRLYLLRHGPAGNRDNWTADDYLRPLTQKGEHTMHAAAAGLKALDPTLDTLLTSPLVRARQTAEIVGEVFHLQVNEHEALSPGFGLAQLAGLLTIFTEARGLMLVGHEPDFSTLIGRLIVPRGEAQVILKKGACCALDLPDETPDQDHAAKQLAGSATLLWLMTARQLGMIAREHD